MAEKEALPLLGVLTRTLVKSPVIRLIIPAHILHASYNDVVFVRNSSIELNVVLAFHKEGDEYPTPYLQAVLCKADFDSEIRAARILGRPRTYEKVAKSEEDVPSKKNIPPVRTTLEQPSHIRPQMPPHILALTLNSSKLVFLCAFYDWTGHPQWLSSHRVLPDHGRSYLRRLGAHIAVEPKSRAMAVAAHEGCFVLYALKPMDQLRDEVETVRGLQSTNFDPISDERFILVDGVILSIGFLHPSKADTDQVILLVITSKNEKTKLHIFLWNGSADLRQAREFGSGQRVSDGDRLPLLVVPLTISTAFMLVFQNHITVYTGVLTGPATPHTHHLSHWEEPEHPGASKNLPIFTQWARTLRHDDHANNQDNIFLCREDGVIRFLEISNNTSNMIDSHHDAGRLRINLNTAFATLDLGANYVGDVLVAGGDSSKGGLWIFGPREEALLVSEIPSWTPMIDLAVTKVKQGSHNASTSLTAGSVQQRMRIFASTGRGPLHGEITEIRYGIEGAIVGVLNPVDSAVTGIWALHDPTGRNVHILVSSPTDTTLLLIKSDEEELPDANPLIDIEFNSRTIAAGLTTNGCIIQVTVTAILVASLLDGRCRLALDRQNETITSASILTSGTHGCILLMTVQKPAGIFLHCAWIRAEVEDMTLQDLGIPVLLPAEPSCLSLQEIQGQLCAFVGTNTGLLLVLGQSDGSNSGLQITFQYEFEGDFAVCDSLAATIDQNCGWLVCGLRDGTIQTFGLASEGRLLLTPLEFFVLGSTAVSVRADGKQQYRAVVACGEIFCTLEYSSEQPQTAKIHNIILTYEERPGFSQDSVTDFAQALHWPVNDSTGFAAGQWLCIEGENFHLVEIRSGWQSTMLPRRMHLDGTPTRLTYSEKLGKLIVLYERIVVKRDRHHDRPGQRATEPTFAFLDTDHGLLRPSQNNPAESKLRVELPHGQPQPANLLSVRECKAGETFRGMMEWFPTDGEKIYHMLVVFTTIVYRDRPPTGRLLFFSSSKNDSCQVSMTLKKVTELNAPVFAVASFGQSSLIYSCGTQIYLHTLKLTSTPRQWLPPAVMSLQSPGAHLTVNGQFVHVTTAAHSFSIIKVSDDNRSLTLQHSNEIARDGISHLDIPALGLVITSSKDGTVTGLQRPPRRRISNSMATAFIADLSGSITRLRRMTRPSWQLSESSTTSRLGPESIIGCTTDGSLYQIDILEESSWRLLRFIVNIARRHPLICPYRERDSGMIDSRQARHVEPSTSNKRSMQVNGDILIRLLDRGGEELLSDVINREPYGEDATGDFHTAAARSDRFWELAEDVGLDTRDFSDVVDWIRRMLVSVL